MSETWGSSLYSCHEGKETSVIFQSCFYESRGGNVSEWLCFWYLCVNEHLGSTHLVWLTHPSIQDIYRRGNGRSAASLAFRRLHRENKSHLWTEPKHTAANWCQDNIVVNLPDNPQKEADGDGWNVQPAQCSRLWISVRSDVGILKCWIVSRGEAAEDR